MPLDRDSSIRLACAISGLTNHHQRICLDIEYAHALIHSATMLREYHAILGIANRLDILARDCPAPATIDTLDLNDGALKPPVKRGPRDDLALVKYMRSLIAASSIAKVEVTSLRDVILHSYTYDEAEKKQVLRIVDGSEGLSYRRSA